jgi:hypothetical protein
MRINYRYSLVGSGVVTININNTGGEVFMCVNLFR